MAKRLDFTDLAAGLARPGNDTREWIAYGTVRGTTSDDDPCVEFERDQPLVRVLLHPSLREVRARVAMPIAGNGEAQWHPFMPEDEVIVVIPGGDERAGAVIVGRLCNEIDKFPDGSIAGQDPRKNLFAFRRTRTPVVEELAGPVMQRSAATGGFISIDDAGVFTLRAGNPDDPDAKQPASGLQMGPDGISMQDPSAKYSVSFGPTSGAFLVLVDDAVLSISSSGGGHPSLLAVPASFAVGTAGNPPLEHVATTESVIALLDAFLKSIGDAFNAIPPSVGGAPGGAPFNIAIQAIAAFGWASAIQSAGTLSPLTFAQITSKFASQGQKPNTPSGQLSPGIGCAGFLTG